MLAGLFIDCRSAFPVRDPSGAQPFSVFRQVWHSTAPSSVASTLGNSSPRPLAPVTGCSGARCHSGAHVGQFLRSASSVLNGPGARFLLFSPCPALGYSNARPTLPWPSSIVATPWIDILGSAPSRSAISARTPSARTSFDRFPWIRPPRRGPSRIGPHRLGPPARPTRIQPPPALPDQI